MEQRRSTIKEFITRHGEASIDQLMELLPDFSAMTIRRDLDFLETQGVLIRTHGGARLNPAGPGREDIYGLREAVHIEEKEIIAHKAAALVNPGSTMYIDAGTTCMAFARSISDVSAPIITNGANIAVELALRCKNTPVHMLGGQLNPLSLAVSGSTAIRNLSGINIDTAFMSTSGFSPDGGFTNGILQEYELKSAVISKSRRVIMLADDSKYNKNLLYTFARAADIHIFVTNRTPPAEFARYLEEAGTKIV